MPEGWPSGPERAEPSLPALGTTGCKCQHFHNPGRALRTALPWLKLLPPYVPVGDHHSTIAEYLLDAVTTCSWHVNNLLQVCTVTSAVDKGVT